MEIVSGLRAKLADKVGKERFELWFGQSTSIALVEGGLVVAETRSNTDRSNPDRTGFAEAKIVPGGDDQVKLFYLADENRIWYPAGMKIDGDKVIVASAKVENPRGVCDGRIVNIGNPHNEASIKELAEMLVARFQEHPLKRYFPVFAGFREVESESFYGQGYEDVQRRKPSIRVARRLLDWRPNIALEAAVERTLDFFLQQAIKCGEFELMETMSCEGSYESLSQ